MNLTEQLLKAGADAVEALRSEIKNPVATIVEDREILAFAFRGQIFQADATEYVARTGHIFGLSVEADQSIALRSILDKWAAKLF